MTSIGFESQMTTGKKHTAFNRALTPSAELAAVIGATPQPRTEVVKLMWEYIKANNLQNPKNTRNIQGLSRGWRESALARHPEFCRRQAQGRLRKG